MSSSSRRGEGSVPCGLCSTRCDGSPNFGMVCSGCVSGCLASLAPACAPLRRDTAAIRGALERLLAGEVASPEASFEVSTGGTSGAAASHGNTDDHEGVQETVGGNSGGSVHAQPPPTSPLPPPRDLEQLAALGVRRCVLRASVAHLRAEVAAREAAVIAKRSAITRRRVRVSEAALELRASWEALDAAFAAATRDTELRVFFYFIFFLNFFFPSLFTSIETRKTKQTVCMNHAC
jgi:hypothetical protein